VSVSLAASEPAVPMQKGDILDRIYRLQSELTSMQPVLHDAEGTFWKGMSKGSTT
jgi:hypothetical protein